MFTKITDFIQSRVMISNEELEKSFTNSEPCTLSKNDYLLHIGEYCRFIGFINRGIIVTTIIDKEGAERATGFIYEGCFFTYTEGLASNNPSHKNFIALEDCELILLGKEHLPKLFLDNPKFEKLLSQLLAEEVKMLLMSEEENKNLTLEERYIRLDKKYPDAFQRIPLKYLADYLGIEAPSLSRLRKRLAGR